MPLTDLNRAFKTSGFFKDAKKAKIKDVELCLAIQQVLLGQVDDLGGGVFKKRLSNNLHRSIILAKGGQYWIYQYLFAKNDRENIERRVACFSSAGQELCRSERAPGWTVAC